MKKIFRLKSIKGMEDQKKLCRQAKQGFSLLEVIIALFVLTIGILGMLTLVTNSIRNSQDSRDLVSASQITQEGIELVRWVRDNNIEQDLAAFTGFASNMGCKIDFRVDYSRSNFTCSSSYTPSDYKLYFNTPSNFILGYNHNVSGASSKFSRKITISSPLTPDTERTVRSYVFWGSDWISATPNSPTECTAIKNCVYAESKITAWGE